MLLLGLLLPPSALGMALGLSVSVASAVCCVLRVCWAALPCGYEPCRVSVFFFLLFELFVLCGGRSNIHLPFLVLVLSL